MTRITIPPIPPDSRWAQLSLWDQWFYVWNKKHPPEWPPPVSDDAKESNGWSTKDEAEWSLDDWRAFASYLWVSGYFMKRELVAVRAELSKKNEKLSRSTRPKDFEKFLKWVKTHPEYTPPISAFVRREYTLEEKLEFLRSPFANFYLECIGIRPPTGGSRQGWRKDVAKAAVRIQAKEKKSGRKMTQAQAIAQAGRDMRLDVEFAVSTIQNYMCKLNHKRR